MLYLLRVGPLPWLLLLSASAFVTAAGLDRPSGVAGLCSATGSALVDGGAMSGSIAGAGLAWLLMLAAMMPPLLAPAITHVCISSFQRRRPLALAAFGAGYALVWLAAGAAFLPAVMQIRAVAPGAATSLTLLALAFVWSASPLAQAARNGCHRMRRISPFGTRAAGDCFVQGVASGVPCVLACWPWMVVPMASDQLHLALMAGITALLFLDRLAPTRPSTWQVPPVLAIAASLFRTETVADSR